ncbi:hypothetical protein BDY21DRAFT_1864 [Lineolata rhizophorae]|uniref:Uncharacterized protein n=1 Tax=Lineolata rhizophorae TaxID=578093 RepID=A0A6A6PDK8_9PEZI|nr:hypothetical protein BDY21DRAFT_1864 [Lineolata rhizophorae]
MHHSFQTARATVPRPSLPCQSSLTKRDARCSLHALAKRKGAAMHWMARPKSLAHTAHMRAGISRLTQHARHPCKEITRKKIKRASRRNLSRTLLCKTHSFLSQSVPKRPNAALKKSGRARAACTTRASGSSRFPSSICAVITAPPCTCVNLISTSLRQTQ